MAQACLGVLLRFDDQVDEDTAEDIPVGKYAAKYWVDHAQFKDTSSQIQDAMEYFFDADKPHFSAWRQVHEIDGEWLVIPPRYWLVPPGRPLYYTSLCGFYDVAKHLAVSQPERVNVRGGLMGNPLGAALYGKHLQVAELLYELGQISAVGTA